MRPGGRLASLDVLRGFAIAGMLLVNNPGSWSHVFPPLRHAEWHGWTLADLVFPFFVFIMGTALAFSLLKHREKVEAGEASAGSLRVRTVRRVALLIILGLLLNGFPFYDFGDLRIPGVLQRLGLVYGLTVLIVTLLKPAGRFVLAVALLVWWWATLTFIPVDGIAPAMEPTRNLQRSIDLMLFGEAHVWQGAATDPEGLLGTPSAVVTCLMGYWAGVFLRDRVIDNIAALRLAVAGLLIASVGQASDLIIPINKPLWTPSFVMLSAGLAMTSLALCVWVVDLKRVRWLLDPFRDIGLNPILVFVGAGMLARLLPLAKVGGYAEAPGVKTFAFDEMVSFGVAPRFASLLFAIAFVFVWWVVAWVLAKWRIIVRV